MDKNDVLEIYDQAYAQEYNQRFLLNEASKRNADFEEGTINKLLNEIGEGAKWLDVACGTGYFLSRFPDVERAGLDLSPTMLKVAKQVNPNALFVQGDYRNKLPQWQGKWDLVTCMWWAYGYVESLPQLEAVIENLADWTSERGACFIPVCEPAGLGTGELRLPYACKNLGGNGGLVQFEGVIWSWIDEESGKQHLNMLAPQLEYMVALFGKYFEQVEIIEYPEFQGASRKAIIARSKKQKESPQTKAKIESPTASGFFLSFFKAIRSQDWWIYKIPPLLAIAYAEILLQTPPPQTALITLLVLLASMFFVAAYGHVVNDIFDVEVDRRANKPNRMADLSISQRILLSTSLAAAGLIPWLFADFSTQSAFLLAGIYTLLTIYSAPPLRLKEKGFWGVITDAAAVHAVPTLFVATVFSQLAQPYQPESVTLATVATLWSFLVGIRGIVLHQIWDQENDEVAGVSTLVVKMGIEAARSWLSFLIFPCEILLLGLLIFIVSQFAPLLGSFFVLYVILRGTNTHLTAPPVFDPAPAQKASVPAHDFYEAWLPLALLVLLSLREASFIPLLAFHIALFYPAIVKRLVEFNPLLLAGRKAMTTLISSGRHQPARTIDSRQLFKAEVTTETFSESPSNELERGIARSVGFLASNQLDDGEFKTEIYQSRKTTAGEFIKEWGFDSSPFATSLVLYSLSFLKHESKVKQITEKGLEFLLREMEFHGLWRYWSSKNPKHSMIPPDLDDICCVSHLLRIHNISHPSNTEILLANRDQQGMFYTWVLPRTLKTIFLNLRTSGKALSHSNELWKLTNKDDVCCVANANALLYLGENQQTQVVIKHLIDTVLEGKEDSSTAFYTHRFSFYYMLSRAYFNGIYSLEVVKNDLINKVLNLQEANGSFGDELLTALAICTLLNLDHYTASLEDAVDFLLKSQQPDGSWQRIPVYGGQLDKATFGSAELTTAFCLEALARYRLLDRVGNLQHNRAELQQVQAQLQQIEQELAQSQSQLHTTQIELIQAQSELQTSKIELARLKFYLQHTQGTLGVIDYYRHAIATDPDNLQLYYQALEIQPTDAQFQLQLGNALIRQGQINEAISRYQTALQFHQDTFEIYLALGKALEQEKQWDTAIAAYQRAIDLNPNHALAHQHLGNTLAERGQLYEASASYRCSLKFQKIV